MGVMRRIGRDAHRHLRGDTVLPVTISASTLMSMSSIDLDTIMPLLLILVLVAFMAIFIAVAYWSRQRHNRAWEDFATRTGLAFEPGRFLGAPRVSGAYRGHPLLVDTYTVHHGKSSTTYARIALGLNRPTGLSLTLYNEGVFASLGKILGGQDIQTGDAELDRRFIIKGQPEQAIRTLFLTGGWTQKLQAARAVHLEVDSQSVRFRTTGVIRDVDYLQSLLDMVSTLADAIEHVSESPVTAPVSGWGR